MRKKSKRQRHGTLGGRRKLQNGSAQLPYECATGHAITSALLSAFWRWVGAGAHLSTDSPDAARAIQAAAISSDTMVLRELARHSNHWVRMALVNNQSTPLTVLWGDGRTDFGVSIRQRRHGQICSAYPLPQAPRRITDQLDRNSE